jgi:excisionase family DNA binding protein
MTRRTLRLAEVAEQLGVSDRTVGGWAAEGRLPSVRVKGVVLIRPEDLEAFLLAHLEGNDVARQRHAATRGVRSA